VTPSVRPTLLTGPESHDMRDVRARGTIACSRSDETGDAPVGRSPSDTWCQADIADRSRVAPHARTIHHGLH